MFYSKEMIRAMGYNSVDEFIKEFIIEHPNCCLKCDCDGVFADYDIDSQPGKSNHGHVFGK